MGKLERRKDVTQEAVESTAIRVGRIATIITTAVADVAREIGDLAGDALEMRQAAKRAKADEERQAGLVDGAAPAQRVADPVGAGEVDTVVDSADSDDTTPPSAT